MGAVSVTVKAGRSQKTLAATFTVATAPPHASNVTHGSQITAANTGWQAYRDAAGKPIASLASSSLASTSAIVAAFGTTVVGKHFTQQVVFDSKQKVTFVACLFDCGVRNYPSLAAFDLQFCTVNVVSGYNGYACGEANYTATRCQFSGASDGVWTGGDATLTECLIGVKGMSSGDHNDGNQSYGGSGARQFVRCNIDGRPTNNVGNQNSALFAADGAVGTYLVQDCMLAGGAYSLRMQDCAWSVTGTWVLQNTYGYAPAYLWAGDNSDRGASIAAWSDNWLVKPDGSGGWVKASALGRP